MRVIDYKTSSIKNDKKTYDEKFWIPEKFKDKEAAQVLIYSEIMSQLKSESEYTIQPYIVSVTNINDGALKYNNNGSTKSKKDIESYEDQNVFLKKETEDSEEKILTVNLRENVNDNLKRIFNELLDPQKKLTQTPNTDNCEYCTYNKICNRNN